MTTSFFSIPKKTNAPLALLLTRDRHLAGTLVEALSQTGRSILAVQDLDDALQVICSRRCEIDLIVIDFDDGCHQMTLLGAIATICQELPIVAIIKEDFEHAAALAYANGATACLVKPLQAAAFEKAFRSIAEQSSSRRLSPNHYENYHPI